MPEDGKMSSLFNINKQNVFKTYLAKKYINTINFNSGLYFL